jgi:RNA polymerase sigma factor (sigma-70 family)
MDIEKFYQKNFIRVVASVYRLIENWHDAEDITQDVFTNYLGIEHGSIEDTSKYLFRMAKNRSIDYIRRKERFNRCIDIMEHAGETDTVGTYDEQFQLAIVYKEIEKMKESKYKTILRQHYIRGKSYEEISKELQVAKNVLRKNKLFGLNKLRERFGV